MTDRVNGDLFHGMRYAVDIGHKFTIRKLLPAL